MKVLQISHKPPWPASDGGCMAMHAVSEAIIASGIELKILTLSTAKHPFKPDLLSAEYVANTAIEGAFVDTRVNLVDAFSSFMTSDSYNVSRFFSPDFDRLLCRVLQETQFDVIWLESLFVTPYIGTCRRLSNARLILRSHNLEYFIWSRMARSNSNIARKAYLHYLAAKLRDYEISTLNAVDAIVAISKEDASRYKRLIKGKPIHMLPFGIDTTKLSAVPPTALPTTLFHLGAMDWSPNVEGLVWFLEKIRPLIHKNRPELKIKLAGRHMPEFLLESRYPNVEITGEVEDAASFISSGDIMIVPLLSAGGVRVKIIEGLALGKAIISTQIGAEGIPAERKKDICIASNPSGFADAVEYLMSGTHFTEMCAAARKLAVKEFDQEVVRARLVGILERNAPE